MKGFSAVNGVPIMMFHNVETDGRPPASVSAADFESQIAVLAQNGWTSVTLRELCDGGEDILQKNVCITFDDACDGVIKFALPILRHYGFVATVFAVPRWVGSTTYYARKKTPPGPVSAAEYGVGVEKTDYMTWGDLEVLQEHGFEIGSHSMSHYHLAEIEHLGLLEQEIVESKEVIARALGSEVFTFCYPYGQHNQDTVRLVSQHYKGAVTVQRGICNSLERRFELPRIPGGGGEWGVARQFHYWNKTRSRHRD